MIDSAMVATFGRLQILTLSRSSPKNLFAHILRYGASLEGSTPPRSLTRAVMHSAIDLKEAVYLT